jgi:cbb3-type cytochrome oxidase subunit 3
MRLSDIMSRMDLTIGPVAALVIFLGIFVLIAMRTIKRSSEDIRAEASLPLLDDAEPGHNPGQH